MDYRIIETAELTGDDDPRRWIHEASNRLWHDELVAVHGNDDLTRPLDAELRLAVANPERRLVVWAALPTGADDGADNVVGIGRLVLPLLDNTHYCQASIIVRPDARGQGIGSALAATILDRARAEGRRVLVTSTGSVPAVETSEPDAVEVGEQLGFIDGSHPAARFLLGSGFRPEQLELHSVLDLPVDAEGLARLHDEAIAYADDYDLITFEDTCPDEHIDGFADLAVAMSTDMPHAEIDVEAQTWDAARIRHQERRRMAAGVRALTVAAQHLPSGRLVGYSTLLHDPTHPAAANQEDTLVLHEHRGHRLGMLLKVLNLRRAQQVWPSVERIHTWNARENDPMLGINFALGFRVVGTESAWQRRLDG